MADSFSVVTREGFGSRFGNSVKGAIVGLGFFIASFPILWMNEGRAVAVAKSLEEGAKAVIGVVADAINSGNEGRLVHLGGQVVASDQPVDPVTGVSVEALGLKREVEMYQWKEREKKEEVKKVGGGTETKTTYTYSRDWDDDQIDSDRFRQTDGHENPRDWPIRGDRFQTGTATVGAFTLSDGARSELGGWTELSAAQAIEFPDSFDDFRRVGDREYFRGADPNDPQVGDMRVRFKYQPEAEYSFVAKQAGDQLAAYTTSNGREILLVESGKQTAEQMFKAAQDRNTILTWVFRGLGALAMWIGLICMFSPLVRIFDILPFLGNLANKGVALISAVLSVFLSIVVIGTAWVFYRPLLGGSLLLVAIALIFWMRRGKPAASAAAPPPPMAPPPPPPPPQ